MPSLQSIQRRISSVKNTEKITRAMKLVSAAKLRRAQERIFGARPYSEKLAQVIRGLSAGVERERYPLMARREGKTAEIMVVTSDRGLCGGFNTAVSRRAMELIRGMEREGYTITVNVVGKKGRDFFKRRGVAMRKEWVGIFDGLTYDRAAELSRDIVEQYTADRFDEFHLVTTVFRSAISQRVAFEKVLPIDPPETPESKFLPLYLYEPSEEAILAALLPKYMEVRIFKALLESSASEQGARMTAMDSATRNAGDMIARLTLVFNKTRQAVITKELMDIVGGAEALK